MRIIVLLFLSLAAAGLAAQAPSTVRVKDIVTYENTGYDTLIGEGLVYGLKGTGDDKDKTTQRMLASVNYNLKQKKLPALPTSSKNVARVTVQVKVNPASAGKGQTISCSIMAADNSKSLQFGTLLLSELRFAYDTSNVKTFATCGGQLILDSVDGKVVNPTNATVEGQLVRSIPYNFYEETIDEYGETKRTMTLLLKHADSTTANSIADSINESADLMPAINAISADNGEDLSRIAKAVADGKVVVTVPQSFIDDDRMMEFKEIVDKASVSPDTVALVTINQASGVITFTGNVKLADGAFSVRGVTITIDPTGNVPTAAEIGDEVEAPTVPVKQPGADLKALLDSFNALKLTADEKIAVIKQMSKGGLLLADVVYE